MQNDVPVGTRVSRKLHQRILARSAEIYATTGVRLKVSGVIRAILEKELLSPKKRAHR